MKNKLFIRSQGHLKPIQWGLFSPNGDLLEHSTSSSLDALHSSMDINQYAVSLIMASPDIAIKHIHLPKSIMNTSLDKIIPNILEESLITPIESIHFSFKKISKTELSIALVQKNILQDWLGPFKEKNIHLSEVLALSLLLKRGSGEWAVLIEKEISIVQLTDTMGFSIDTDLLESYLEHCHIQAEEKPNKIHLYTSEKQKNFFKSSPLLQALVVMHHDNPWSIIAPLTPTINLLQGTYHPVNSNKNTKKLLMHTFLVTGVVFAALLSSQIRDGFRYQEQATQLEEDIGKIYFSIYPDATSVVSPRKRIEQDLKTLNHKDNTFYHLLYVIGNTIRNHNTVEIQDLRYQQGEIKISLKSQNYSDIEKVILKLKQSNLTVAQNTTEQQLGNTIASFSVTKAKHK